METEPYNMTCIDTKKAHKLKFVNEKKDIGVIFDTKVEDFKSLQTKYKRQIS